MTTQKAIATIIESWAAYQNDMRPETRNDFLRCFDKNVGSLQPQIPEWQPIGTLPKETQCLGYCQHTSEYGFLYLDDFGLGKIGFATHMNKNNKPTHWMSLPAAPKDPK